MKRENKQMIAYAAAFELSELIGMLTIPVPTLDEIEKLQNIRKILQPAIEEYQSKLNEILKDHGIAKLEETSPKEVMRSANELIVQSSSVEVEAVQFYTREELEKMTMRTKRPLDLNELTLLHSALVLTIK